MSYYITVTNCRSFLPLGSHILLFTSNLPKRSGSRSALAFSLYVQGRDAKPACECAAGRRSLLMNDFPVMRFGGTGRAGTIKGVEIVLNVSGTSLCWTIQ